MATSAEPSSKVNFYNQYTPDQDVVGAKWLSANNVNNSFIYGDLIGTRTLSTFALISDNTLKDLGNNTYVGNTSLVYLRTFNVEDGYVIPSYFPAFNIKEINSELNGYSLLYNNGQNVIYESHG
jgi:uncharacterized membrane protein